MERSFSCLLISRENHTNYPEENNVISRYKHIGWIEIIQIFCLFWPTKCGKWPKSGRKPCIQRVFILYKMRASTFWAYLWHLSIYNHFPAFLTRSEERRVGIEC